MDSEAISANGNASQRRGSTRGHVTHVSGRSAKAGGKGLPAIAEIDLTREVGHVIQARLPGLHSAETETATVVRAIEPAGFPVCPICLESPGETREHVPPKPLGGSVMTHTCTACNGGLGSRTESALKDWFDSAVRISYTRAGDPAHFGHNRALWLQAADGGFVLLHEQGRDALNTQLAVGGSIVSHQTWPRRDEYKTGLLKNAYLAACLSLRGVPFIESANEIRAELLAARNASSRAAVTMGPRARDLRVYRTATAASGPPLALVRTVSGIAGKDGVPRTTDECEYLLSLAGTLLVTWPFPEVLPTAQFVGQADQQPSGTEPTRPGPGFGPTTTIGTATS